LLDEDVDDDDDEVFVRGMTGTSLLDSEDVEEEDE
jgi:hypothetical protein